jgi:predicted aldo/keto reductase-like oxidoreductase
MRAGKACQGKPVRVGCMAEKVRERGVNDGGRSFLHTTFPGLAPGSRRRICRLGLASRGNTYLTADDVAYAMSRGINFLNWCGTPNAFAQGLAELGASRSEVIICVQFEARTATDARAELSHILRELRTDYLDVLTFYYVEEPTEWQQLIEAGGALEFCRAAQRDGIVRLLGLTSHQRPLAAEVARSGLLDMLMIRYNAAHRGAETDVFPVTDARGMPVIAYTCLRWGALLHETPEDPAAFVAPPAPAWYRFALQSPSVAVALMAPENRAELEEDLTVLDAPGPLAAEEYQRLAEHGQRVRTHGGNFP